VLFATFLLLLGVFSAQLLNRRRTALALLTTCLIVILVGGTAPFPRSLLEPLQTAYQNNVSAWKKRPAIVLLGMGTEPIGDSGKFEVGGFSQARLLKTLELYHDCESRGPDDCKLVVSGGDPQAHGHSEAEIYTSRLVELGVEPDDIIQEPASRSTWENARNTSAILKNKGFDQIVVVTSGVHVQRSDLYFRHFGINATPIRADFINPVPGLLPNATNLWLTTVALHEYIGILRYHVYTSLGWND